MTSHRPKGNWIFGNLNINMAPNVFRNLEVKYDQWQKRPRSSFKLNQSGQIRTTSAEVTPNGGLVRESPQNPMNSGLGIIVICPDQSMSQQPNNLLQPTLSRPTYHQRIVIAYENHIGGLTWANEQKPKNLFFLGGLGYEILPFVIKRQTKKNPTLYL